MPAWMKRKMLSMSSSTSRCSSSRKYSAIVSAAWPTRNRLPGGSFIWPKTITMFGKHAGFLHVAVELLAFATAFADAAEDADALLVPDHVVDHFGEQHRLAHARPAEESRLAAALQRHEHVDDLDARLEDFGLGGTSCQRRRSPMHRTPLDIGQRRLAVDGVAEHVEHPRENPFADRRLQRPARVLHRHAASETLRGRQRNPAHVMRITLRQHFDDDLLCPLPRAAPSRSAANAHRTGYPRRCRAPRRPCRDSSDRRLWQTSAFYASPNHCRASTAAA